MRVAAAALVLLLSSCATLLHGPKQEVEVVTQPRGAVVAVDGEAAGITPATLTLDRERRRTTLRLTREGYEPDRVTLGRTFNWWSVVEDYGLCFVATSIYYLARYTNDDPGYLASSAALSSVFYAAPLFAIDALNGAVWRQSPAAAEVVLTPLPPSTEPSSTVSFPVLSATRTAESGPQTISVPPSSSTLPADSSPAH